MSSLLFLLLVAIYSCHEIYGNTVTTTDKLSATEVGRMLTQDENKHKAHEKQISWKDLIIPKYKLLKLDDLKKLANTKMNFTDRKSKLLGSLAFLAGLSVNGLADAASSNINAYARVPSLAFNLGASRISPHFAAFYDPYPMIPHSYVLANPLGLYSLLDPSRLQSVGERPIQHDTESQTQNQILSQVQNVVDNQKPIDLLNNNEDYDEEAKKAENDKTSNDVKEETDGSAVLRVEADRNAEEKITSRDSACGTAKGSHKKHHSFPKDVPTGRQDLQQDADDSSAALHFQAANKPERFLTTTTRRTQTTHSSGGRPGGHYHRPAHDTNAVTIPFTMQNETTTSVPMTTTTTENSTASTNETASPPFAGYFYGNQQNVDNVDFTTESDIYKYHDYGQVNYNLPYERPANFYPDERYHYYSNPPVNHYQPSQFQQDQVPEYFTNEFGRLLYPSDNTPQYTNGFRPIV